MTAPLLHQPSRFRDFTVAPLSEADRAAVAALIDPLAPPIWLHFAEQLMTGLRAAQPLEALNDTALALIAVRQAYQLAVALGGDTVYLPIGHFTANAGRARALVEDFKRGDADVPALARRHGYTKARAGQILREYGLGSGRGKKNTPAKARTPISNPSKAETHPKGAAHQFDGL